MPLKSLGGQFGYGGTGLTDGTLRGAVSELQGLTTVVVAGAAANTDIAVAGLGATDHIQSVLAFDAGVPSVVTPSVQAAGTIQFAVATTGKTLVVNFYKK